MRSQPQFPEDPQAHFTDFVGNQRSPLWDDMEQMDDSNQKLRDDIEELNKVIDSLTAQKEDAIRLNLIKECYDAADPEKTNAITMKPLVAKLSGFAKFEVDHKLSKEIFTDLICRITGMGESFNQEKFTAVTDALSKAFKEGAVPFQGDLENETYKEITQVFREFNPSVSEQ